MYIIESLFYESIVQTPFLSYLCTMKHSLASQMDDNTTNLNDSEIISEEILEAMGISSAAYEEILTIIGRLPTVDELSTLLAMWHSSGNKQGLLTWLKGQPHSAERHDYIENHNEPQSREIKEPRIKDCVAIAKKLFASKDKTPIVSNEESFLHRGDAIYMVGDVSELFVNSDYGRDYLHLVENPIELPGEDETSEYLELILDTVLENETIFSICKVGTGGLFGTILRCSATKKLGFDIQSYREVRLDAFLFGEQGVRYLITTEEKNEDFFLQKLTEARVNCCFLGRTTKGRVLVDGMDFGDISVYI